MLTDRERKMYTIIYNLFKAKRKHTTVADLKQYMLLSQSEIMESLQQLKDKKQVVEVQSGCYIVHEMVYSYRHINNYKNDRTL